MAAPAPAIKRTAAPALAVSSADDPTLVCRNAALGSPQDLRIARMVAEAERQHSLFGGQAIDTRGRLVRVGYAEGEFDRPPGATIPTWRRVHEFWAALDKPESRRVRAGISSSVPLARLQQRLASLVTPAPGDAQWASVAAEPSSDDAAAFEASMLRAAVIDNPWSAVFISHLAQVANAPATAFLRSDAHADYVEEGMRATAADLSGQPSDALYRACDLSRTQPSTGDLICYVRDRAEADSYGFPQVREALALRRARGGGPYPMHCDIVVAVDTAAAKLDAIGGNVAQSVTRRRMNLQAGNPALLSKVYLAGRAPPRCRSKDAPGCGSLAWGLNFQYWTVLLQSRRQGSP